MLFVDILDNLPRMRLSNAHMEMILYVMEQTGAQNVPNIRELRQFQSRQRQIYGTKTQECHSELGNVFFVNDIRSTLAMACATFCR